MVDAVVIQTGIRLRDARGGPVVLRGRFAALAEPETLDMCVLGRDITNLFAVIVDRPGGTVCLVGERHSYQITGP